MISDSELLRLHREEKKSYTELAKLTGKHPDNVRARIRRAKRREEYPAKDPEEKPAQVTTEARQNTKEITSTGARITTLAQLLEYCQVDLNEWTIDRHVINKWEVGRRATVKNLTFVDGEISGEINDNGGINVEPLFQIKVWLTKKRPQAVKPVIRPVVFHTVPGPAQVEPRSLHAALVLFDPHFGFARDVRSNELAPFHDRAALAAVLAIAQVLKPETTAVGGDVVDYAGWSDKYIKRPEFYFTTQPSLIEASWYLAQLRAITSGDMYDIEGNHEVRPEKMIINHLVDAYDLRSADQLGQAPLLSVDNLLGLSRMGVEYVTGYPDAQIWLNASTKVIHGEKVRGAPGQTAAAVVRDADETIIFGHVHRREHATKTIPGRDGARVVTAFCPGCMCHTDGRVPGSKRSDQWQQGAAIIWFDDEISAVEPIEITNGAAIWRGQVYQGEDYAGRLRYETGWNF